MTGVASLVDVTEGDRRRSVKELVLDGEYVSTDELLDSLGGVPTRVSIARMRAQGALVAVKVARRGYLYPKFQVDVTRGRIDPVVARINKALTQKFGNDDAIRWWLTARTRSSAMTPSVLAKSGGYEELHGRLQGLLI